MTFVCRVCVTSQLWQINGLVELKERLLYTLHLQLHFMLIMLMPSDAGLMSAGTG